MCLLCLTRMSTLSSMHTHNYDLCCCWCDSGHLPPIQPEMSVTSLAMYFVLMCHHRCMASTTTQPGTSSSSSSTSSSSTSIPTTTTTATTTSPLSPALNCSTIFSHICKGKPLPMRDHEDNFRLTANQHTQPHHHHYHRHRHSHHKNRNYFSKVKCPISEQVAKVLCRVALLLWLLTPPTMSTSASSVVMATHNFTSDQWRFSLQNQTNYNMSQALHYHHTNHRHLLSSYSPKSFNKFTKSSSSIKSNNGQTQSQIQSQSDQQQKLSNAEATNTNTNSKQHKRELMLLSQEEPIKTFGDGGNNGGNTNYWLHSPTSRRFRRLTHLYSGGVGGATNVPASSKVSPYLTSSSLPIYAKVNLKPSNYGAMSSLSAFSAPASGTNNANSNRLKIMLNPPAGFGAAFGAPKPNIKCNYDIYPSGCFDENGSVCDSSGSGLCVCRPGFLIRTGGVYCLRPTAIGEACYTTEQCERKVANSGCFNYREEYREENPSAFFGPSQSSWPMGECRCRTGHRLDVKTNSCVRSLIGSWCSNVWDCELAIDHDDGGHNDGHRFNQNRSSYGHVSSGHSHTGHSTSTTTNRSKLANVVCENNVCNCSLHFHYNQSSESCQFVETFGQTCEPDKASGQSKRNVRYQDYVLEQSESTTAGDANHKHQSQDDTEKRHYYGYYRRNIRSVAYEDLDSNLVNCNLPTVCSINGTCVCMEGYEHQPTMVPQCQPTGGHFTYFYHSGSSIRSGVKGDHGGNMYEGQSNVANFFEYVLYVLVPALVVILMFKPCFRRIGKSISRCRK